MDNVWWKQVTKANLFIKEAINTLLDDQSLVLCLSDHLPWPETMRELIMDGVNTANFDRTIRLMDASEAEGDPGAYLLRNYCSADLRSKYRPGKGGYAKFLAECEGSTLSGAYIWIKNASPTEVKAWNSFIGDYLSYLGKRSGGVFLLEAGGEGEISRKKNLRVMVYEKEIGAYDAFVFNLLLAAEYAGSVYGKQYLAELASLVAPESLELGGECIRRGEAFLSDPFGVYSQLAADFGVSSKSRDEIDRCMWTAQIKLVFPLIEEFRRKFIKRRSSFIAGSLPHPDTAGHIIDDPKEVEIGMLNFLASKDQWPLNHGEWEGIKVHHEARNILAHMGTLSPDRLKEIFRAHT